MFAALGDPTRRRILELLDDRARSISELSRPLGISLAGVVQHVQALEECGLLSSEKVGRVRYCRVSPDGLSVASAWIDDRRARLERKLDKLGDMLGEP